MLTYFPNIQIPHPAGDIRQGAAALLDVNGKAATRAHSESVAVVAAGIAARYGLDVAICETGAYLHDISAVIAPTAMLDFAVRHDWPLDEAEKRHPFLLHQRFSALIAEEDFGVTDERVLSAVACHSTLKAQPSDYDMALFVADKLAWDQPERPPYYKTVNEALAVSLAAASLAYMDYIVQHKTLLYPHRQFEEGLRFLRKERAMAAVNPALVAYVQAHILPLYESFDAAHRMGHVEKVIDNALALADEFNVDVNLIYTAAAYHDTGLAQGREGHETASKEKLLTDGMLPQWFTESEINLMADAAEDHRASSNHAPRSLYGRIIAEADRDIDYTTILTRTVQYSLRHFPDYNREQHFTRTFEHIRDKYGEEGYITLWLDAGPNRRNLRELREAVRDNERLKEDFMRIYDRIIKIGDAI